MALLLTETLNHHWSTGQGTRIRHILWSSPSREPGDACSGSDANIAGAVGTAIYAHLRYDAEVEPLLGEILRVSGEFARFDREETATPEGLPVIYSPTPANAEPIDWQ